MSTPKPKLSPESHMLLHAHSGLRYLVLLSALVTVGYALYGWIGKRPYDPRMRVMSAVFIGLLDLTVLAGFATMFVGAFYPQLGGHLVMMILAAAVAHIVHAVQKRRPPTERTYPPHVIGTGVCAVLIVFGILAIGRSVVG